MLSVCSPLHGLYTPALYPYLPLLHLIFEWWNSPEIHPWLFPFISFISLNYHMLVLVFKRDWYFHDPKLYKSNSNFPRATGLLCKCQSTTPFECLISFSNLAQSELFISQHCFPALQSCSLPLLPISQKGLILYPIVLQSSVTALLHFLLSY